ncbi:hypothetical protein HX13_09900 [Chryseobacterium sp. P1-3]|uniref:hypothetical protein n=1 Tax=Chryseobacterium sp. (strain P1-3) TaxID=1517683 RepID=UPI0004E65DA3|nr:hypothetical protein [Chryseobacterium sp. P1-3]KFF74459.1 hypothetical protein HX13_09900 [Chryseobacterium sp. P1-3]
MKKIIVLAMALSLTATAISCKKETGKMGNTVLNLGGEAEANSVIDFNNNFVDSYKKYVQAD